MTSPAVPAPVPGTAPPSPGRFPVATGIARYGVLAAFPLSLGSPGATVALAVVGLAGLYLWVRCGALPADLRGPGRMLLGLYGLLLAVDLANGGGAANLTSTAVNYLPLLAAVPFALALRQAGLSLRAVEGAMLVAIVIAAASSGYQYFVHGGHRMGGLNLNEIPFGLVLLIWGLWLFSRGLDRPVSLAGAGALVSIAPIAMTGSRNVFLCLVVGAAAIVTYRSLRSRDWRLMVLPVVVLGVTLAIVPETYLGYYLSRGWEELRLALETGSLSDRSLGARAELLAAGMAAFAESPILGHGLAESLAAVRAHLPDTEAGAYAATLGHLHNDYATHMVAFGVFGAAFLLGFLAFVQHAAARTRDPALAGFGAGLVAVLAVYMLFEVAFNMDPVSGAWGVALGVLLAFGREPPPAPRMQG